MLPLAPKPSESHARDGAPLRPASRHRRRGGNAERNSAGLDDPECVDALNTLAFGTARSEGELIDRLEEAVATGVCTKGNVYIQVHVVSPSSLTSAKADLSSLVGAAYQGVN